MSHQVIIVTAQLFALDDAGRFVFVFVCRECLSPETMSALSGRQHHTHPQPDCLAVCFGDEGRD